MAEDRKIYVGQKVLIEKDEKVLVLIDGKNRLDFPGGKIQVTDKSLEEALQREIQEEVKLEITLGKPFSSSFFPSGYLEAKPDEGMYVILYLAHYVAGKVILSDEHISYEWVDSESYKKYKSYPDSSHFFQILESYFLDKKE